MTAPIAIVGAGAFGTALAIALARQGTKVWLWARNTQAALQLQTTRVSAPLSGQALPETVSVTADLADIRGCEAILMSVPMQSLSALLGQYRTEFDGKSVIACCKGVDLATLDGPTALITQACPASASMVLTGPSFASDIARGQATALSLASTDDDACRELQRQLSGQILRIYRNSDVVGCELGGALKNVVAIAAGLVMGAGLGESARAALMTRGFAEMVRFSTRLGARPETLMGLSGFGDLVLTCTSEQSRNYRHGFALGCGIKPDPSQTVEGVATAKAIVLKATQLGMLDHIPVTAMVASVTAGAMSIPEAIQLLMSRPLKEE